MKTKYILASLLFASVGAHAATIHTGLLNYWALDGNGEDSASDFVEGTSTIEDDVTVGGTAGAATILGSGGLFGGAVDFERGTATDGRLETANVANADIDFGSESFTTSMWVQFDDNSSGNWQALLVRGEGSNYRLATHRNNTAQMTSNNSAAAAIGAGDIHSGVNIRSGNWHHIVATATPGSTVSLYVDGVLTGTQASSGITNTNDNGEGLWIGNNNNAPSRMWDGLIDDVAQWDRALTATEVTEIYDAGIAGVSLGQIPEPTSGLLVGLGSLMVALRRRRR